MNQATLKNEAVFEGVGVHSGRPVRIVCHPAAPDTGLVFLRSDLPGRPTLPARLEHVAANDSLRRTVLQHRDGWTIETPEHLLASCVGLGITNLLIEINASEVPILDGSAAVFTRGFLKAELAAQKQHRAHTWTVRHPLSFREGDAEFAALPGENALTVAYFLDFPGTVVGRQGIVAGVDPETFPEDLAPARTFVLQSDIEALRKRGLIRGGTPEIAVVIGPETYLNPPLRFPDECARHKVLDLLGDLALVGGLPRGHFMVNRAGHAAHLAFGQFLRKDDRLAWSPTNPNP